MHPARGRQSAKRAQKLTCILPSYTERKISETAAKCIGCNGVFRLPLLFACLRVTLGCTDCMFICIRIDCGNIFDDCRASSALDHETQMRSTDAFEQENRNASNPHIHILFLGSVEHQMIFPLDAGQKQVTLGRSLPKSLPMKCCWPIRNFRTKTNKVNIQTNITIPSSMGVVPLSKLINIDFLGKN